MKRIKIIFVLAILALAGAASFFLNKNQKEDPLTLGEFSSLKWEKVTENAGWSKRDSHVAIVFNNKIYLMGGLEGEKEIGESVKYEDFLHKNDVWSSADGKNWELISEHAPWSERRSIPLVEFNGKMCIFGGWEQKQYGQYRNDVWCSENGKNWQEIASGGWPLREGHAVVFFKDKLWLIGGVNFYEKQTMNDVWSSVDGIKWTKVVDSAPWAPRYDHALTVFQDKLWIIGGLDADRVVKKDVWFSSDGANWQLATNNPPFLARNGHAALVYKDALWIISGWGQRSGLADVWYTKDGLNWLRPKEKAPWPGREDHAAVVFNNKIFMMGGMADEKPNWVWKNDVWSTVINK